VLRGFSILLSFQLAGEVITRLAGWPIPGPVVGMALLLGALTLGLPSEGGLSQVSSGLLAHLSLLFVPAGVGVMLHGARLAAEWPAVVGALLVSTGATFAVTGLVEERLAARAGGAGKEGP
jgi:holin-like protein